MKAQALKRGLSDMQNSMSEITDLATMGRTSTSSSTTTQSTMGEIKMSNNSTMSKLQQR